MINDLSGVQVVVRTGVAIPQGNMLPEFPETPRADLAGSKDTTTAGIGGRVNDPPQNAEPA